MTDLTLTISRQIAASPANVWRCLTEPDLLKRWFAPDPVAVPEAEIDLTPGGIFRIVMQMPGQDPMDGDPGCVLLVEPERRIVWTAALGPGFVPNPPHTNAEDFYMTADMTLEPSQGGTLYTARALHATPAAVTAHEAMGFHDGWGTTAGQLEDLAKTL